MWRLRWSLVAIMAMLGLGYLTRYCGMDATMGMAMAHTGVLFPFFGTMIGWLGVALSGSLTEHKVRGEGMAVTVHAFGTAVRARVSGPPALPRPVLGLR